MSQTIANGFLSIEGRKESRDNVSTKCRPRSRYTRTAVNILQNMMPTTSLDVSLLCGIIILSSLFNYSTCIQTDDIQKSSQCFKSRGIPKVSFDCRGDMIRIHRAFHGIGLADRRITPDSGATGVNKCYSGRGFDPVNCTYCEGDCIDDAMNLVYDWSTCMGYPACSRTVMQSHMPSCPGRDKFSDYLQVEYQCIAKTRTIDICESVDKVVQYGYLTSPDYPNVYPTNVDCKCTLTADRPDARIIISFYDLLLETRLGRCRADWIMLRQNGAKHRHCGAIMSGTKNVTTSSNVVELQFHSDEFDNRTQNFRYFSRNLKGFWLYFTAEPEATVHISCKKLPSNHPDVVEIFSDDMDYDDVSGRSQAPSLDRESPGAPGGLNEPLLRETDRVNRNSSTDLALQEVSMATISTNGSQSLENQASSHARSTYNFLSSVVTIVVMHVVLFTSS